RQCAGRVHGVSGDRARGRGGRPGGSTCAATAAARACHFARPAHRACEAPPRALTFPLPGDKVIAQLRLATWGLMALASMTGFAEARGTHAGLRWRWEARSVNGRALDIRLRTP